MRTDHSALPVGPDPETIGIAASYEALMEPVGHSPPHSEVLVTGGSGANDSRDLGGAEVLRSAGAEPYLPKSVPTDGPDRETIIILRRCAGAAPTGRIIAPLLELGV